MFRKECSTQRFQNLILANKKPYESSSFFHAISQTAESQHAAFTKMDQREISENTMRQAPW